MTKIPSHEERMESAKKRAQADADVIAGLRARIEAARAEARAMTEDCSRAVAQSRILHALDSGAFVAKSDAGGSLRGSATRTDAT